MPTSRGGAGGYHQEHWTPFMVAAERGNLGLCRLLSRHPQFDARRHLGAASGADEKAAPEGKEEGKRVAFA